MKALAAALCLLSTLALSSAQQPSATQPSFRSASSELVVLPVTVTDNRGALVSDVARDRFSVFDNGRRQDLALFTNEDTPVTVGLIVDNSGSIGPKLGEIVAATMAFARASHPEDELFALEFNDNVKDAIPGGQILAKDFSALQNALTSLVPEGRTALYDALIAGLDRLEAGTRPRRVLLLLSDGGDNASRSTKDQVLARARASNVTIYTIGVFDEHDAETNPGVLKSIAEATGGKRFLPKSPGVLLADCQRIAREIRSGYTLGFEPRDRDGQYHRVRVEVDPGTGKKLTVRTRPGYFAASAQTTP